MKLPKPVFTERQVGTSWAYDIQLGDKLIATSPVARTKKKEARSEVARLCLKQLGLCRPSTAATASPAASKRYPRGSSSCHSFSSCIQETIKRINQGEMAHHNFKQLVIIRLLQLSKLLLLLLPGFQSKDLRDLSPV